MMLQDDARQRALGVWEPVFEVDMECLHARHVVSPRLLYS